MQSWGGWLEQGWGWKGRADSRGGHGQTLFPWNWGVCWKNAFSALRLQSVHANTCVCDLINSELESAEVQVVE